MFPKEFRNYAWSLKQKYILISLPQKSAAGTFQDSKRHDCPLALRGNQHQETDLKMERIREANAA